MDETLNHKKDHWNSKYIIVFLLTVFVVLVPVFIINFVYDPGDIYLQRMLKTKYTEDYVKRLMSSFSGVRQFGNERLVKGALAQKAGDFDVVILGSSHAMQLSSIRMPQFHRAFAGRVLNLAVSGGTLEDLMIYSHIILHNLRMPKALLIEIGPWSLKWGMDVRYMIHQDHLDSMLSELGVKPPQKAQSYWLALLGNAVNFEYFKQSLKRLRDPSFKVIPDNPLKEYGQVGAFDYNKGYEFAVTLNDGSHVYEKSYIEKMKTIKDYMEDFDYKLAGEDYNEGAISVFEKLINVIKKKHIEVYFFLAPYNPMIFKATDTLPAQRFARVENRIKEIAKRKNVKMFGSYDPKESHLVEADFLDLMHAKVTGLDKISFSH